MASPLLRNPDAERLAELYERYQSEPGSVEPDWQEFFGSLDRGAVEDAAAGIARQRVEGQIPWQGIVKGDAAGCLRAARGARHDSGRHASRGRGRHRTAPGSPSPGGKAPECRGIRPRSSHAPGGGARGAWGVRRGA